MWRDVYPLLIHFAVAQIMGSIFLVLLTNLYAEPMKVYYRGAMELSGVVGILAMLFMLCFYRNDKAAREYGRLIPDPGGCPMNWKEGLWLLVIGGGLAIFINMLVNALMMFLPSGTYAQDMELITQGKSIWEMILWIGIVSPLAEEVIFRWGIYLRLRDSMKVWAAAVISGAIFGIYHGNLLQGIYAGIMGAFFAWFLEMSGNHWSSVLMHIGANVISLVISEYGIWLGTYMGGVVLLLYGAFLAAVVSGVMYFARKGKKRGYRAI